MAEKEEAKQAQVQEQAETGTPEVKEEKKKPNFSKPFIISGILLGICAGAPFLNLGNYIFGLWGWVFGLLAAWYLSKEYKYFQVAHGGMVGFFTGLIGSVIAMAIDIGLCLAGISTYTLLPALERVGGIMAFWIPARFHSAIILAPWSKLNEIYRMKVVAGEQAVTPTMTLTGHAFFMVPLLAGTAIVGGVIGWKLFAKEAPKRQFAPQRRRRRPPAGGPPADKPVQEQSAQSGVPAAAGGEPAASSSNAQGEPEKSESFDYESRLPDSPEGEQKAQEQQEETEKNKEK